MTRCLTRGPRGPWDPMREAQRSPGRASGLWPGPRGGGEAGVLGLGGAEELEEGALCQALDARALPSASGNARTRGCPVLLPGSLGGDFSF